MLIFPEQQLFSFHDSCQLQNRVDTLQVLQPIAKQCQRCRLWATTLLSPSLSSSSSTPSSVSNLTYQLDNLGLHTSKNDETRMSNTAPVKNYSNLLEEGSNGALQTSFLLDSDLLYTSTKQQQLDFKKIGDFFKAFCQSSPSSKPLTDDVLIALQTVIFELFAPIFVPVFYHPSNLPHLSLLLPSIEGIWLFLSHFSASPLLSDARTRFRTLFGQPMSPFLTHHVQHINFTFSFLSVLSSFSFGHVLFLDACPWILHLHTDTLVSVVSQLDQLISPSSLLLTCLKSILFMLVTFKHVLKTKCQEADWEHVVDEALAQCVHTMVSHPACALEEKKLVVVTKVHGDLVRQKEDIVAYATPIFNSFLTDTSSALPLLTIKPFTDPSATLFLRFAWIRALFACTSTFSFSFATSLVTYVLSSSSMSYPSRVLRLDIAEFYCARYKAVVDLSFTPLPSTFLLDLSQCAWSAYLDTSMQTLHMKAKHVCVFLVQWTDKVHDLFLTWVFQFEPTHSLRLTMLAALLPYLGLTKLIARDPTVFESAFSGLHHQGLAGKIKDFLCQWLVVVQHETRNDFDSKEHWLNIYAKHMVTCLIHPNVKTRKFMMSHLLTPLLKVEPGLYGHCCAELIKVTSVHPTSTTASLPLKDATCLLEAFLALERVAISLAIPTSDAPSNSVGLSHRVHACTHPSASLRLDGLGWVADPRQPTTPLTKDMFLFLSTFLQLNVHEPTTAFREHMVSRFQPIMVRLQESGALLHRRVTKYHDLDAKKKLTMYHHFVQWWLDWLVHALVPSSGLAITSCLGFLEHVLGLLPQVPFLKVTLDVDFIFRVLLDVFLISPFESVLFSVVRLWRRLPLVQSHIKVLHSMLGTFFQSPKSQAIQKAGLIVDYFCDIYSSMPYCFDEVVHADSEKTPLEQFFWHHHARAESQLKITETSILHAATYEPLPSTLLALACIYCKHSTLLNVNPIALCQMVQKAFTLVHDIVACAAPEGTLPDEYDGSQEEEEEYEVDAASASQLVSSFAWRVVKEGCELLSSIFTKLDPSKEELHSFWPEIGNFIVQMMFQLRHRGAFLAVYPVFIQLCDIIAHHSELPKLWIDDILQKLSTIDILLTRRSGGAPFVMLAALSPKGCHKYLDWAFRTLFDHCEASSTVIQVNNMNVLRRLFTDSHLSKVANAFVEQAFILSFTKIQAKEWSLRNAGLMLFSTLINREFGTTRAQQDDYVIKQVSGKKFFKLYPSLFDFFLQQIDVTKPDVESSFPLLTLLSRFTNSNEEDLTSYTLSKFLPFVMVCSASPSWKLRAMAASAIFPLIPPSQLEEHCSFLFNCLMDKTREQVPENENQTHGFLLQLAVLIERSPNHGLTLHNWISLIHSLQPRSSQFSLALAYQIFHVLASASSDGDQLSEREPLIDLAPWFDFHWSGYGSHLARLQLLRAASMHQHPFSLTKSVLHRLLYDSDKLVRDAAFKFGVQLNLLDRNTLSKWKTDALFPVTSAFLETCMSLNYLPWSWQELYELYEMTNVPLSVKQTTLVALGHFVEGTYSEKYFQLISITAQSNSLLPLREATLDSLEHFFRSNSNFPHLLWLALTTLLHDDDADLRRATSVMLSTQVVKAPYPMHEHALFLHLLENASSFLDLNDLKTTLHEILAQHRQSNSTKKRLFDNEKDNLYKDDFSLSILILRTLHRHGWNVSHLLNELFESIQSSSTDIETEKDFVYGTLLSLAKSDTALDSIDSRISFIRKFYLTNSPLLFSSYDVIPFAA